MNNERYKTQVDLLVRILPHVAEEGNFALKGGTAINMFVWDMPRLSVDIDLTYTPFDDRNIALANIADSLKRLHDEIKKTIPGIQVETKRAGNNPEAKLICTLQNDQVKIEVNTIMRGSIKPARLMPLCAAAQKEFNKFTEIKVASNAELFGGKICAALDRQHPRDLFDIHQLFNNGGITEEIKDGFIACLLSHPKPINEVLQPTIHNQNQAFDNQFQGMTTRPFSYADFETTRERLLQEIRAILSDKDKALLLSIKSGNPDWSLSNTQQLQNLPAIKWKLQNIQKFKQQDSIQHAAALQKLEKVLA
jgi:predicted nucleotidyltransferase component of viral defense system